MARGGGRSGSTPASDVIIDLDTDYRASLLDRLRRDQGFGTRRDGVHVSDLVSCTRKAWAERTLEFTQTVSDETVLTWLRGLSHEELVSEGVTQVRSGYCFPCQRNWYPGDFVHRDQDVWCPVMTCGTRLLTGTIDWEHDDATPVEMKSTMKSSRRRLEDGEMAWYVDQVKSYMAMHGKDTGRIAIMFNMGDYSRTDPDFRDGGPRPELDVYRVQWRDVNARANWLVTLEARKALVEGVEMPPLDRHSPAHPYICQYCTVGERLPDGTECENFPWELAPSGQWVRKGSGKGLVVSLEDVTAELQEMQRQLEEGAANGTAL